MVTDEFLENRIILQKSVATIGFIWFFWFQKCILLYIFVQVFLVIRCIRSHISFFRLGLTPTLNTATQGCSRRGRAWAPGQKPSPALQMKWHFVQGCMESRKLESRSSPLLSLPCHPLLWKVWLHKWFMHWITGLNLTLYGCCIATFWWAFTSLDWFTIWPWMNSTTKHRF